jgi:hypothetical protein
MQSEIPFIPVNKEHYTSSEILQFPLICFCLRIPTERRGYAHILKIQVIGNEKGMVIQTYANKRDKSDISEQTASERLGVQEHFKENLSPCKKIVYIYGSKTDV